LASGASAVDLNPPGFNFSAAQGTNGTQQVGTGSGPATGNVYHALLWTGSAASAIDLGSLLPATFGESEAYTISGDTVYGVAFNQQTGNEDVIVWTVPEPGAAGLLAIGGGLLAMRRRRLTAPV
jgi:PEP-CTERM motif